LNLKVALLLLLVFASTVTATAITFNIQTPVSAGASTSMVFSNDSYVEPLGDPIEGPGVPN